MSHPMIIHGDVMALMRDIIVNHTPELDLYDPFHVSSDLRGYNEGLRWIMITLEGGFTTPYNILNKPRIDIEVRADSRSTAHDMAQICHSTLFRAVPHRAYGATLSDVRTELGLVNVPDKEEVASYRYLFAIRAVCLVDPDSAPGAQS